MKVEKIWYCAGADPGLVVGGGANSLGRGAPTQYIYTFSEKPHEIKEILVRRGEAPGAPPKSATAVGHLFGCLL